VINKFIKQSLTDDTLTVYEPGTMKRDFVYVDDVIGALETVASSDRTIGETYLAASGRSITVKQLAEQIIETTGRGELKLVEWPESWDGIRVGDIVTDPTKLQDHTSWEPQTSFQEGLDATTEYYEQNLKQYVKN
jgi:nucleoside-diphosphate-sugar epimerase